MAKIFFDTEFHEYKAFGVDTIELISLGMCKENGDGLHVISREFNVQSAWRNEWLRKNVLKPLFDGMNEDFYENTKTFEYQTLYNMIKENGKTKEEIQQIILKFVGDGEKPEFYAYYSAYDWVVFCWIFGRMIDLPKHFPMYCRDLKHVLDEACLWVGSELEEVKAHPNYPVNKKEHDALQDARWNERLYNFIHEHLISY